MMVDMLSKKVLIVDDVFTTGKTLNDIKTLLSNLNINGVTLFSMFG
jgi:predicted amidophosphoribosyltransferase